MYHILQDVVNELRDVGIKIGYQAFTVVTSDAGIPKEEMHDVVSLLSLHINIPHQNLD